MASKRVLRFVVPVDDQWHPVMLSGLGSAPVHVAARHADVVEFWAVQWDASTPIQRYFRVFGTGQVAEGDYCGSTLAAGGGLVWHLFERTTI